MKNVWIKIKAFFKKYWNYILSSLGLVFAYLCGRHFRNQCLGLDEAIELRKDDRERITRTTSTVEQCQSRVNDCQDRVEELIRDTDSVRSIVDKYDSKLSEASTKK